MSPGIAPGGAQPAGLAFGRVAVIGVGLIGGSFALALRAAGLCNHVVGVGRDPENMRLALERGVIDSVQTDIGAAVEGAGLVLVATPVAQFPVVFAAVAKSLAPHALLIDAGSTKQDVVAAARVALGGRIGQFVPTHPIAGGENSGALAAKAELFRGKRVVVSPLPENAAVAVEAVVAAWEACGASIFRMSAEEHDAVFAAVSHLPHVLAFALVREYCERANAGQLFGFAGGGFRDFTRIASSHPEMWRDICVANRAAILTELDHYVARLQAVRTSLAEGDGSALEGMFQTARDARNRWIAGEFDV